MGQRFAYYWLDSTSQGHIGVFDLSDESSVEVASGNIRMNSIDWSPVGLELLYISADPAPAPVSPDERFLDHLHRRLWRNGTETVLSGVRAARFVAGELVVLGGGPTTLAKTLANPRNEDIQTFAVSGGRIYAEIMETGRPVVKRWNPGSNAYDFVAPGEIFDAADSGLAIRSFTGGGAEYSFVSNGAATATTLSSAATFSTQLASGPTWKLPFSGSAYVVQGGDLYQWRIVRRRRLLHHGAQETARVRTRLAAAYGTESGQYPHSCRGGRYGRGDYEQYDVQHADDHLLGRLG